MSDFDVFWKNRDEAAGKAGTYCNAQNFSVLHPSVNSIYRQFIQPHPLAKGGFVVKSSTYLKVINASGEHFVFGGETDFAVPSAAQRLDTGTALQAGRDYYIYLCLTTNAADENAADIVVSLNNTFPAGYNAYTSRKLGGFHTLCVGAGVIAAHPLSGYLAGEILPASFWDLTHRPSCNPEGMVYSKEADVWVDIYLQSGTGANTKSVFNGTVVNLRTHFDHIEDMFIVGKRLLYDHEFAASMEGSNQETNITGSAQPLTTGGHIDTTNRRMLSNIGCEDGVGAYWQWLQESMNYIVSVGAVNTYKSGYTDNGTYRGGNPKVAIEITDGRIPGNAWIQRGTDTKGQVYNLTGLLAGGHWSHGADCGSRARNANNSRLSCLAGNGARGAANSI